ncbi:MAG: hypothetical protein ACKV1O_16270 [Saprospiraceae bacterium]
MQPLQKRKVLAHFGLFQLSFWVIIGGFTPFWLSCEKEEAPIVIVERGEPEILKGLLESNRTLRNKYSASDAPDYLVTGVYKVLDASLKIEAGVIIHFAYNAGLEISDNAILEISGNEANKVVLTGISPIPGFWRGIRIETDQHCVIAHTEIHYGGGNWFDYNQGANILIKGEVGSLRNRSIDVHDCLITNSPLFGIYLDGSVANASLQRNIFRDQGLSPVVCPSYLLKGIDVTTSDYSENGHNGIFLIHGPLEIDDVVYLSFGFNNFPDDEVAHWKKLPEGGTYRGLASMSKLLTVDPGVIFEIFPGGIFELWGGIMAEGTADQKIIFRNIPGLENFGTILLFGNHSNTMNHCIVSNGGASAGFPHSANITVWERQQLSLSNSLINNSEGCGIFLSAPHTGITPYLTQINNTFESNATGDICE